ncbi:General secretion pathway protein K [gamma proteobacterium IMCC1989]|nr:General secretion pathway protein K [gamma proteobacterium IMCC1989]
MKNHLKKHSKIRRYKRQKGSVLLIAVFITSVIVAIAARFTGDFQLSVARAGHNIIGAQLQHYIYSVEEFASWMLEQDADDDNSNGRYVKNGQQGSYDHLEEEWMTELTVPVEDATITAQLTDALSRFNINQLQGRPTLYNPQGTFNERFTTGQQRFMRLLQTQPDNLVDTTLAQSITEAVIDWIDSDNTITGQGGAEDSYYSSLEAPLRTANQPFISVTELRQIKGMSNDIYNYLSPLLIALPSDVGFNVNTALVPVMRSLNQQNIETPLDETDVELLLSDRPIAQQIVRADEQDDVVDAREAFESTDEFLASDAISRAFDNDPDFWPDAEGLRTGSEYFILEVEVTINDYQRRQISLLKRELTSEGVKTKVLRRTRQQL